jgi:hypothetical protein
VLRARGRAARAGAPPARAADAPATKPDPALAGSTVAALLAANDGKPPATGKELVAALAKIGTFAQMPVVFSAVHMESGLANPRVVIAPVAAPSGTDPTRPNVLGRLYLAANMERHPQGGDPRVTSVEFISWNALRRKFDFGVIADMGTTEPKLTLVEGGKCFACHKNRGPILGAGPWSNTTSQPHIRALVGERLRIVDALPPGAPAGLRDRIDGMALVAPESAAVDDSVRAGAVLTLNREKFRLMNRSDSGRTAFVALLGSLVAPGPLDPMPVATRTALDLWAYDNDRSYLKFCNDWLALGKTTNSGILHDYSPVPIKADEWDTKSLMPVPVAGPNVIAAAAVPGATTNSYYLKGPNGERVRNPALPPPPPPSGNKELDRAARTAATTATAMTQAQARAVIKAHEDAVKLAVWHNEKVVGTRNAKVAALTGYDARRAAGFPAFPSAAQPSNPKAFVYVAPKVTQKPTGMLNTTMLASTIGLNAGDRDYMADALADAAKRLAKQKVTAAALAKQVFEGPEFADVLAGGPLPDRDDFKDRFVAGLSALLAAKYHDAAFAPDRATYASGPRRDPKALEQIEAAIVPTTACLRCHDVRNGKARVFDPIPPLAFDPLDKAARAEWLRTADPKRKQEVLARLAERVFADADMPPRDAPEHDGFRVKQAVVFDDLKKFLDAELKGKK